MSYEDYLSKMYKHMHTDSYLYITRQISKYMMRNSRVTVRTKKVSTQKMSNSKMSMQNIPNLYVCSTD